MNAQTAQQILMDTYSLHTNNCLLNGLKILSKHYGNLDEVTDIDSAEITIGGFAASVEKMTKNEVRQMGMNGWQYKPALDAWQYN